MPIINSVISAGKTPTGTKTITSNGVVDVADYANADVQVPTTAPAYYIEKTVDTYGALVSSGSHIIDLSGVNSVGEYGLAYAYCNATFPSNSSITFTIPSGTSNGSFYAMFRGAKNLTQVTIQTTGAGAITNGQYIFQNMFSSCSSLVSTDLSSITSITAFGQTFTYAFYQCSNLTTVDFSGLVNITAMSCFENAFQNCYSLTAVKFDSLKTIDAQNAFTNAFGYCSSLQTVDFPSLESVSTNGNPLWPNMFTSCTALKTVKFNKLKTINCPLTNSYDQMFSECSKLESVEFGGLIASTFASLKNQLRYLFNTTTGSSAPNGCTVHFPSNFDPSDPNHTFDASTLTGYPTFGGSASYIHVAFDLPATE